MITGHESEDILTPEVVRGLSQDGLRLALVVSLEVLERDHMDAVLDELERSLRPMPCYAAGLLRELWNRRHDGERL